MEVENMLKEPLVWIDCEMTGLKVGQDCLLEVAVIITDGQLKKVDEGIDIIIKPEPGCLEQMDDFVRNMHSSSGLLADLENGIGVKDAAEQVLSYIKKYVPNPKSALLAGNSVGTDKMFLEAQMPAVIDHLHYRIVDVSSLKEMAKRWFPRSYYQAPKKTGGHRALGDIQDSIRELEYYRAVLFPKGDGPSSEECAAVASDISRTVK